MKRNAQPLALTISAIVAITVLAVLAIYKGVDGKLLALAIGAICGIAGFKLKGILG